MKLYAHRNRSIAWISITRVFAIVMLSGGVLAPMPVASADAPVRLVARPSHQETIHDNLGEVPVVASLQGTTLTTGRQLRVLLDGTSYGQKRQSLSFTLARVDRGEHTLRVELVDETNAMIAVSPTITFYLWQASRVMSMR
jgi:hypothetical protein